MPDRVGSAVKVLISPPKGPRGIQGGEIARAAPARASRVARTAAARVWGFISLSPWKRMQVVRPGVSIGFLEHPDAVRRGGVDPAWIARIGNERVDGRGLQPAAPPLPGGAAVVAAEDPAVVGDRVDPTREC